MFLYAEAHGCASLKKKAESYIFNNILEIVLEDEFFTLSWDQVANLMSSEKLRIENEFQVIF